MGKSIQWRPENTKQPRSYGEMVRYGGRRDGGQAYLAHSDRVGPGVLVVHEGYGLQPGWFSFADRLMDDGFTVLVPDLFDGRVGNTLDEARALGTGLDRQFTSMRLKAAAEFLSDNWHPRVGIVGFSMGGMLALELAANGLCDALVVFYGMPDGSAGTIDCPVLVHLAGSDELMPNEDALAAFGEMEDAGADIEMIEYPGARHSFANPSTDAFDEAAANEALAATCDFFHHHLA
jgi:carboxymethylenebutenolidase